MQGVVKEPRGLTSLPPELLHIVMSSLSDVDLARVSLTSRYLSALASDDRLWQRIIRQKLPVQLNSLPPEQYTDTAHIAACPSYKDLYTSMHPFWFLPQRRIWFSDTPMYGKLVISRYDPRRGAIEAYSVVAERGEYGMGVTAFADNPQVEYCSFHPKVQLDLNQPVLSLKMEDIMQARSKSVGIPQEVAMRSPSKHRVSSAFLLSKALPNTAIGPGTQVWPPLSLPAHQAQRTRNSSNNSFRSSGHQPTTHGEVCDSTFRIRQWAQFSPTFPGNIGRYMSGGKIGEHVTTFGTLSEDAYTPTTEKPWQGIWCGDYSAHGCEFILVTQPDNPRPLPEHAQKAALNWPEMDGNMPFSQSAGGHRSHSDEAQTATEADEPATAQAAAANAKPTGFRLNEFDAPSSTDAAPYRGRLEAVKLTGDPNVPRGEYTWIADLGASGAVGYTNDPVFEQHAGPLAGQSLSEDRVPLLAKDPKGARVVKSIGHIATRGFSTDSYIPTQLILVNENTIAQYWEPFGHMSFYRRVDIDRFLTA